MKTILQGARRSSACPDRVFRSSRDHASQEFKAFRYIIIGAGSAATAAVQAIREIDQDGEILLVGDTVQKALPYHKPPLSDALHGAQQSPHTQPLPSQQSPHSQPQQPSPSHQHQKRGYDIAGYAPVLDFSDISDEPETSDEHHPAKSDPRLTHYRHVHAKALDSQLHRVTLTDGTIFEYDSVLLATGGSPYTPPCLQALGDNCMTYRTIKDYKRLKEVCKRVKTVCVVGSGLLSSELASSIANIGLKVVQLSNGPGIYCTLLPKYLSDYITEESHTRGVEVRSGTVVDTKKLSNGSHELILDNGSVIETEFTVICGGRQPNVEIAESAGLPISKEDGGVVVEATLEVAPDIYAAGDIISWKDPIFKQYRRVDHHDHALHSGEIAGKNMCGQAIEYNHQPFFWSDLGFFAFEAVGLINSQLETVSVWKTENAVPIILLPEDNPPKGFQFTTGFVYYLQNSYIVGVVLVGMFGKLEQARAMIIQRRITIQKPEDCKNLISFNQ